MGRRLAKVGADMRKTNITFFWFAIPDVALIWCLVSTVGNDLANINQSNQIHDSGTT